MLLIRSTNNTQERLITPLVDRLEGEITPQAREQLLASCSERKGYSCSDLEEEEVEMEELGLHDLIELLEEEDEEQGMSKEEENEYFHFIDENVGELSNNQ